MIGSSAVATRNGESATNRFAPFSVHWNDIGFGAEAYIEPYLPEWQVGLSLNTRVPGSVSPFKDLINFIKARLTT